jgi:hypothetical protein
MGAELFHADRQADMKLISQLWTRLKSSYNLMLQKHTATLNGDVWQQGDKEGAGFKGKVKQEAGINCMINPFVPRADISAFAPRAKSAASRYIGSSVDHY